MPISIVSFVNTNDLYALTITAITIQLPKNIQPYVTKGDAISQNVVAK